MGHFVNFLSPINLFACLTGLLASVAGLAAGSQECPLELVVRVTGCVGRKAGKELCDPLEMGAGKSKRSQ